MYNKKENMFKKVQSTSNGLSTMLLLALQQQIRCSIKNCKDFRDFVVNICSITPLCTTIHFFIFLTFADFTAEFSERSESDPFTGTSTSLSLPPGGAKFCTIVNVYSKLLVETIKCRSNLAEDSL